MNMLRNISTTTLTQAKKRWRRAYFTVHFTNTMAKNTIPIIPEIVVPDVSINIKDESHHQCFYGIDQTQLNINIVKNEYLAMLQRFDGVNGLAKALDTDLENGINTQDLNKRRAEFGSNTYQKPPLKGLFYFVVEALKDVTILILMGCAALSLGYGIKEDGIKDGWYEGGSTLLAIFLVIVVSAIANFGQEKELEILDVVREGRKQKISMFDIVVGDIVALNVGDHIPADGLFIDGDPLLVDESSMTGESQQVEVHALNSPFLLSGSKVTDGHCRMLVLSVGMNTARGKMMSSITDDSVKQTPLHSSLNKLTSLIGKIGVAVSFLVLIMLLIHYFNGNIEAKNGNREDNWKRMSVNEILDLVAGIFSAAVAIPVVVIPESLPLVVTLTLAYSMKRMMGDQAIWETMGSTTVICTENSTNEIKTITEDNDFTAEAIHIKFGILESGQEECEEEVVESVEFHDFTQTDHKKCVMARSSPFDKFLMALKWLKQQGQVVPGDETNDAPALEEAHIDLSIEIQGTEGPTLSSDIVIPDDVIAFVSTELMWGRCVYNDIQKFIQFQLIANFAALAVNSLKAVHLLRVNLIIDTLGALALAREGPTKELLTKLPMGREVEPLITNIMWRNLFAQAIIQITVLMVFQFKGEAIFNMEERVKNNLSFITFVLCQLFNEFNSRKLTKRNIFRGIHKNRLFVGIKGITIILQIVMVRFLKIFDKTDRSICVHWGVCIAIAALSWWSQKEDAWNSENDFRATTVESMKKRTEELESELALLSEERMWLVSKGLKYVVDQGLHASDELVKPLVELNTRASHVGFQEGLKTGYHFCMRGVAIEKTSYFDPNALEELKQVVETLDCTCSHLIN